MIINAIIGIAIFEYAYWLSRRIRDGDEDRDSKFPAMRRTDTRKWRRWKFWPFAMTLLPLRIFTLLYMAIIIVLKFKFLGCGHDFNKGPLKAGFLKSFLYKWVRLSDYLLLANCGFFCNKKNLDVDYTKYLGPDYKETKRPVKKASTIISNHVSWLDSHFIFLYYNVAFTLDKAFETMPIMNQTARCLDSIFVQKAGTDAQRDQIIKEIGDR